MGKQAGGGRLVGDLKRKMAINHVLKCWENMKQLESQIEYKSSSPDMDLDEADAKKKRQGRRNMMNEIVENEMKRNEIKSNQDEQQNQSIASQSSISRDERRFIHSRSRGWVPITTPTVPSPPVRPSRPRRWGSVGRRTWPSIRIVPMWM